MIVLLWQASPALANSLSINDVAEFEGDTGTNDFLFTVTLTPVSTNTVTVDYRLVNGLAKQGSDLVNTTGTVTFLPGQTNQTIAVGVKGDTLFELDEDFYVQLQFPVNATIADAWGQGTILNDDIILVDDRNLYATTAAATINWAAHLQGRLEDTVQIRGVVNPSGSFPNPAGASISLTINGIPIVTSPPLDSRGRGSSATCTALFNPSTGAFSLLVRGADLRGVFGLLNENASGLLKAIFRLDFHNAGLDVAAVAAELEFNYLSRQDKATRLRYLFKPNRIYSGLFQSVRSSARLLRSGNYEVSFIGPLRSDGGEPFMPAGDVVITIGTRSYFIPFIELFRAPFEDLLDPGFIDENSGWFYWPRGPLRFAAYNEFKRFEISATDIPPGEFPPPGPAQPTRFKMPLSILVQTEAGPKLFQTTIEFQRSDPFTTRWYR